MDFQETPPAVSTNGFPVWRDRLETEAGVVEVRFVGRGPDISRKAPREEILAAIEPAPPELAWVKQIHSAEVVAAEPGFCGEGDALVGATGGLALTVISADCVPILVAGGGRLAAIHAGWRGIVAGVVSEALAELGNAECPTAWIGPAIGPCCYEVGEEVAAEVTAATTKKVAKPGPRGRPHLDLTAAVRHQLAQGGVEEIRSIAPCTLCNPDDLWSYRRTGPGAGRNLAAIWRTR